MTISYHSGERIQATSTDFAGSPAVSGGWKELGRTTLGSSNSSMSTTSLSDKKYYMILTNSVGYSGSANSNLRCNSDSGSNYAERVSVDGGTDSTGGSYNAASFAHGNGSTPNFGVGYMSNLSTKEKLWTSHNIRQGTAGAGNAPIRAEQVGKWANTSSAVSGIDILTTSAVTHSTGSETVILGWDEDDTHTTNFWEELASVDLSGGATNTLSTGTFTAKKYLWVQIYTNIDGSTAANPEVRFNSDSGSNYARRSASNGGSDGDSLNQTVLPYVTQGTAIPAFLNMFIINNASNEKLAIAHSMEGYTAGAGNAPKRNEMVHKWTNTSVQITEIEINQHSSISSNNFGSNSFIKVWGSN